MTISNQASGIRPGVCTSTTRPTSPYVGMIIFETDTGKMLYWTGSVWQIPLNFPWGYLTHSTLAGGTTLTGSPATVFNVSYTHIANRRLRVTAQFNTSISPATNTAARLQVNSVTIAYHDVVSSNQPSYSLVGYTTSTGSAQTFNVAFLYGSTPSSSVINGSSLALLLIEDIGPT